MLLAFFFFFFFFFFYLQAPLSLPTSKVSISLSVQEKKFKADFQHGGYGNHPGYPIRFFNLQVTLIDPFNVIVFNRTTDQLQ